MSVESTGAGAGKCFTASVDSMAAGLNESNPDRHSFISPTLEDGQGRREIYSGLDSFLTMVSRAGARTVSLGRAFPSRIVLCTEEKSPVAIVHAACNSLVLAGVSLSERVCVTFYVGQ